jgi:DNA-directed RNA polymerase specialized sigma24 family protein
MANDESSLEKTLTALLLASLRGLGQKEQIAILDRAGFGQTEIARLLGSTSKAISVRLAEIRRTARSEPRAAKRAWI